VDVGARGVRCVSVATDALDRAGFRSGTGVLKVDGKEVARRTMERTIPVGLQWDENFDMGADTGTPVSDDYQVPFKFTGKLNKLTLKIDRPELTTADIEKLRQATRNNRASE
jgi:arylsulfatase